MSAGVILCLVVAAIAILGICREFARIGRHR